MTRALLFVCLGAASLGCVDAPRFLYGARITGEDFEPINERVGVHPDDSVLDDPNNPFSDGPIGEETRWDIEGFGDPVAAFYCWATLLTSVPTGEHQYYVGASLQRIYEQGRAAEEDLPAVRDLAIAAYQVVLDEFPGAVTFDNTGRIAYGLATPAYNGIVALGGAPQGGWALLSDGEGNEIALKVNDAPSPDEEEER